MPKLEVHFAINEGKINNFSFDTLRNILWISQSEGKVYYIDVSKKPFEIELAFQTSATTKCYFIEFNPNVNDAIFLFC